MQLEYFKENPYAGPLDLTKRLYADGGIKGFLRGQGFTAATSVIANIPRFFLTLWAITSLGAEDGSKLKSGVGLAAGLSVFYPLELTRLRLMLDLPREREIKASSFVKSLMEISPKELYHGAGPWMAHGVLTWGTYAFLHT